MTRDDVKKILMMMSAAYPNFKPQDKTVTINTWYMICTEHRPVDRKDENCRYSAAA